MSNQIYFDAMKAKGLADAADLQERSSSLDAVSYTHLAYLVRKRATQEAMPRMLRWALNNRLFHQKTQSGGGPGV